MKVCDHCGWGVVWRKVGADQRWMAFERAHKSMPHKCKPRRIVETASPRFQSWQAKPDEEKLRLSRAVSERRW